MISYERIMSQSCPGALKYVVLKMVETKRDAPEFPMKELTFSRISTLLHS